MDLSKTSVPSVLVVGVLVAVSAWGICGHIKAWELDTEKALKEAIAAERSEEIMPIRERVDQIYAFMIAEQADRKPFKKEHYEALRRMVGDGWPIYDDLAMMVEERSHANK